MTQINQLRLWELLYLEAKEELGPVERADLAIWYAHFDQVGNSAVFLDSSSEEAVKNALLAKIMAGIARQKVNPRHLLWRYSKPKYWIAAVFLLTLGCLFFVKQREVNFYFSQLTQQPSSRWQVYTCAPGKLMKVALMDGSIVWLRGGSTLHYPSAFDDKRIVSLEGEAFFEIAKQEGKPFIVHTDYLSTRVLGTSFNVQAYPTAEQVEITVATGKVEVLKDTKALAKLLPNRSLRYSKSNQQVLLQDKPAEQASAWRKGIIRLAGVSFDELALQLHRSHGITLICEDAEIRKVSFSTQYRQTDDLPDILAMLTRIANCQAKKENDKIRFYRE